MKLILASSVQPTKSTSKRSKYTKWSDEQRYEVGKYTSLYGPAAAVRKFKQRFPSLNENTARTFRSRVEADLKAAKKEGVAPKKAIPRYSTKTGRPLMLGEDLDSMVQKYLLAASNREQLFQGQVLFEQRKLY